MIKIAFITFFIFTATAFPQKSIIIFKSDYSENYMPYAVGDLLTKNIFIYSNLKIIPNNSTLKYAEVKSKIKKLTLDNKADVSVAYEVKAFRDGFLLNYIIFDNEEPNRWTEKSLYSHKEENFFVSINGLLKELYDRVKNKEINYINENDYTALIGYYSRKSHSNENNIYELFYDFHKDNIYFNLDYFEYLTENGYDYDFMEDFLKNMPNYIDKRNHYYLYCLGRLYYDKYKVNVEEKDINASIENYKRAVELKNNYYGYYYELAKAYAIKNDYERAVIFYEKAAELNEFDAALIKDLSNALKRDMGKNGEKLIYYLKKIIEIDKNGEYGEYAMEELAKLYENIGDYNGALIYYKELLNMVNNNLTDDQNDYNRYVSKRNFLRLKIDSLNNKIND